MTQGSNAHYGILVDKLQEFIAKFYLQQWLKGLLQWLLLMICIYLLTSTLEYNLYLSSAVRTLFFFLFSILFISLFIYWVALPLVRYYDNRKRLNHKQAAGIIGRYFPDVKDKLLNVIYLNEMQESNQSMELIAASIQQKSQSLVLVKFTDAVDWAMNKKLAKYLALPFAIILLLLLFAPHFLRESTHRLIHYDQAFAPKAPFNFKILNPSLRVTQFEPLTLRAKLEGKSLPEELHLMYNGVKHPMTSLGNNEYEFIIKSVEEAAVFRLESLNYLSDEYRIDVLPKPLITDFEIDIIPPSYTGIKSSTQKNSGDIQAPEGSTAIWKFKTQHIDQIQLIHSGKVFLAEKYSNGFGIKLNLRDISNYTIVVGNQYMPRRDTQLFNVSLVSDAHPYISLQEFNDSINEIKYYGGDISDDYGISGLYFVVQYGGKLARTKVPTSSGKNANFQFSTHKLFNAYPKGAEINYYFEVFDNDGVHGAKSTKSSIFHHRKLTEKELEKVVDMNATQIQSEMTQSLKDAKQFQKDLEAAKKKLLEKERMDFSDKKLVEELVKKQEELQQKLEKTKEDIQRNFEKKNELTQQEQALLDQQKQLEEIVEQMKNPELQDLLKKINELLEKEDKKEMLNNIQKMDERSEKMEKNFDRLLQLYKNLDYKQKLNDMIEKLDVLSKEQKKLALESQNQKETKEAQKKLNEEVKEAQKKMDELSKLNDDVNKTDKKEFDEIKKDMQDAGNQQESAEKDLENSDKKSGSEKQDKASEKLDDAKKKLNSLKSKQKKKQNAEDARMMRRLLENVIYLSFEQEKILEKTKITSTQSPGYIKLMQSEQKIIEDFKLVEDTLYKIASRQVKLRKFIFEEADKITSNTDLSVKRLVDRRPDMAITNEQYAMAAFNKLGLMISESLKNMQDEDENENESESQQCDNPKKGKKKKKSMSLEKLAEMQQQLNDQMQQLQQQMMQKQQGQQGKESQEGKGKPKEGKGSQQPDGKEAAEFAKIAAQQQAIRNLLKKIEENENSPNKSGKKPFGNELKDAMDKMNETEKDLVNKRLYNEMLQRQRDIQVKLLESAKAEREQDEEQRRESERAKNIPPEAPLEFKQFIQNKKQNESQIQRTPVGLTPYFKSLAEKYFQSIK